MAEPVQGPAGTWQRLAWWGDSGIDLAATAARMPCDDVYASAEITAERPGLLHHVPGTPGSWFIWDGRCHRPDTSDASVRIIAEWALRYEQALAECRRAVTARVTAQAGLAPGAQLRAAVKLAWEPFAPAQKYAASLRKSAGASSLLRYLAGITGVAEEDMADRHPDRLNFANGTLDLRTGRLCGHDPEDLITYCLDVDYDPSAACPLYWELLHRACGRDREVTAFLARALGYCLIGRNPRQVMFFLSGPTASGKSALLTVLTRSLGLLGHESQPALVCLTRHGRNARTENSIRGARLVTITETSSYMTIEEAQVKRLTGEEWLNIDRHYEKAELGTPVTWTIILATNQMPSLVNFDDAMARRVIVIPMGETVPWHERDEELVRKITDTERGAILSWLAGEAMAYYRDGLAVPEAVSSFTRKYAADQDTTARFAAERCLLNGHLGAYNVPSHISQADAWTGYQDWSRGQPKLGRNEFYTAMSRLPGVVRNEDQRRFEGIMWKPQGPLG